MQDVESNSGETDSRNRKERASGYLTGEIPTPNGAVPVISTRLTTTDIVGAWKVRWGIGRMRYTVAPGLYAAGTPSPSSPVLVTANYKLTFDMLRRELGGRDLWILILDTKGINVWCAAGKGTFGTEELVSRIGATGLDGIVSHRTVILPQLGAPGTAAHEVTRRTGFRVVYGPVRAKDIPSFLDAGMIAAPGMRRVKFTVADRAVLVPMELAGILKPAFIALACFIAVSMIRRLHESAGSIVLGGFLDFLPFLGAAAAGSVLTPLILPWLPGRALSVKGWSAGLLWAALCIALFGSGLWESLLYILALPPLASCLAMNFSGATVYTSLSGVVKEMKYSIPVMALSAVLGITAGITGIVVGK